MPRSDQNVNMAFKPRITNSARVYYCHVKAGWLPFCCL